MSVRTSRLIALACALAVGLAACGGEAGDVAGDPTPTPSPTVEETPTPTDEAAPEARPSPRIVPVPARDREAVDGPLTPREFTDPTDLAEQLVAAETAIRDAATPAEELRAWAWTQQQAYRDLVVNPDWRDEVRAEMPEDLREAFDRNVHAGARLREMTSPRDDLPDWRIEEPPPADELRGYYEEAADEFGLEWHYLASIHLVETRMGRIRGVSVAGARGPMQFMPRTWDAYGEGDIEDPRDAIRAAARYLRASGAPGDMRRALFAYNRSDRYVDAIIDYAEVMKADERAHLAYHHWQVFYRLSSGDVILPVGWERGS